MRASSPQTCASEEGVAPIADDVGDNECDASNICYDPHDVPMRLLPSADRGATVNANCVTWISLDGVARRRYYNMFTCEWTWAADTVNPVLDPQGRLCIRAHRRLWRVEDAIAEAWSTRPSAPAQRHPAPPRQRASRLERLRRHLTTSGLEGVEAIRAHATLHGLGVSTVWCYAYELCRTLELEECDATVRQLIPPGDPAWQIVRDIFERSEEQVFSLPMSAYVPTDAVCGASTDLMSKVRLIRLLAEMSMSCRTA